MSDIPDDIRATAEYIVRNYTRGLTLPPWERLIDATANAIASERERCAKIAERMLQFADTTSRADIEIADAIRTPTEGR